jgi:hypothetical protein
MTAILLRLRVPLALAAALALLESGDAFAQASPTDKVAAETLFNEARALAAQKRFDEACPKFAASQRLEPAVGTLLNLSECYQRKGQLASAWVQYREAAGLAASRSDERRAQLARDKAAALESKLGRLKIHAAQTVAVERDGARVDPALFDTDVPVDAGAHVIEAKAPGKKPWRTTITSKDGEVMRVDVPALEDAPLEAAPPPPPSPKGVTAPPPPPPSRDAGGGQRIAGLVVAGVGIVGLGLGTFFALDAKSKWSSVTDKCPDKVCPDAATRDSVAATKDSASTSATLGTVGFVAGGALLVGGAVLFFTAPKGPAAERAVRVTPLAGPTIAGLAIDGVLP